MALSVAARATSGSSSSSSTIAVTLPSGIAAGDLLVLFVESTQAQTTPSGWTRDGTETSFSGRYTDKYWKIASGSEGSSVNISLSSPGVFSALSFRITGHDGTGIVGSSAVTGSSTAPDPPNLAPGGTGDRLYIALFGSSVSTGSVTGWPTGYSNTQSNVVAFSNCTTASAEKIAAGSSSDNPSAFTFTSSNWAAYTIAIKGVPPVQTISGVGGITTQEAVGSILVFDPTAPVSIHVFIDWNRDGAFGPTDEISGIRSVSWDRGRSADFSGDATGSASLVLNDEGANLNSPGPITSLVQSGDLIPGLPVLIKSSWHGIDKPHFFGFIQRITPNATDFSSTITIYDPLKRFQETDVVVPASALVSRSARDFRREVLAEVERGSLNLVSNPAFAVNTSGWTGTVLTRITSDHPAGAVACGQWAATGAATLSTPVYLAPVFLSGQIYTISAYVKWVSGSTDITIGGNYAATTMTRPYTATGTWTRISASFTIPSTTYPVSTAPLWALIGVADTATILVGNVQVTRGQTLYPYDDVGSGRWGNWCSNGSFDGGALNGWYDGFHNLCGNPSFEVDTSGWSAAGDAFVAAAAVARKTTAPIAFGIARAEISSSPGGGIFYAIAGTFKAGVTYDVSAWVAASTGTVLVGIGSQGTPADKAESTAATVLSLQRIATTWSPSADRTDAHLYIKQVSGSTAVSVDGVAVFRRDASATVGPVYSDTGPGGGGAFNTSRGISTTAKYGARSQEFVTPATATAGRIYDFYHNGVEFIGGRAYTLSLWLNPTSDMPYKVGFGANNLSGGWDEASTTGTAPAGVWTQVTVTWTPAADRTAVTPFSTVAYVYQTDATARTVLVDGVRAIPATSADEFEMAHWDLDATEDDEYGTGASLNGSALSALNTLNALTLTRHYIRPSLTAPYYVYVSSARKSLPSKTVVETMDNNFAGFESYDIDRDSIVNVIPIFAANGDVEYFSDEASILKYGPRPIGQINGAGFYPDWTVPADVAAALLARYKDPKARPTLRRKNKNTIQTQSILDRELDDLIEISIDRLGIASQKYLIVKSQVSVSKGGVIWEASWGLEEHAY